MTTTVNAGNVKPADLAGIEEAARAYLEGYTKGDPEWHRRAYHPEAVKRRMYVDAESGVTQIAFLSPQTMVDHAATGLSTVEDCDYEVVIDDVYENIAARRTYACKWVEFLHIVKARGEWRILHATWHPVA